MTLPSPQLCIQRPVAAGGRTWARPCGWSGICGPIDVLEWQRTAESWVRTAMDAAKTPAQAERALALRTRMERMGVGFPNDLVNSYRLISSRGSCMLTEFTASTQPQPTPEPEPEPEPEPTNDNGWEFPDVPDLPDIPWPSMPKFPAMPDMGAGWIVVLALLLFGTGYIMGDD